MNTIHKQQIVISLGEKDNKIGSPTYGQPLMEIKLEGIDPILALKLVTIAHGNFQNAALAKIEELEKRVHNLTKLQIEK